MWGKRFKGFIWVFTVFIMLFGMTNVQAKEEEKIKLKVEAGIDSVYKIGNTVPINISIENNLKDINGELQIEVDTSQIENQNNVNLYVQSINIPNNSLKTINLNVPISKYLTQIKINIVEGKNTLFQKSVNIPGGNNYENIIIGILSDNYDSVSYMNNIKLNISRSFTVKNVKLNENNFPLDSEVLNNLNIIIVNDFDTSKLNEKQYEALKEWVSDGGMLLIGTGPSYNKSLSLFKKDNFISGEIGDVTDINTKALYEIAEDHMSKPVKLSCVSMNIQGSTQPVKEGSFPLVHRIEKGKGAVSIAAFDFGINPIASWTQKSMFASRLMGTLMPDYFTSGYGEKMMALSKDPYLITNVLKNIADLPVPKGKTLAFIFLVYIILAAPVNYMILKKLDKREWMWVTVPLLSIVFGIFMYFFGFSTRISEPIANVLTNITINKNGGSTSNIYAGIITPSKKNIKVEGSEGMNVKMLPVLNYEHMGMPSNGKAPKIVNAKINLGAKSSIEFYGNSVFSTKAVQLEDDSLKAGGIDCSINYSNGMFAGEVYNNSGFDLEEAYIITSDNYIVLGPLKNGEKKAVNEKGNYYNGNIYEFSEKLWKNPFSGPNPKTNLTDEEAKQFRKNEQKRAAMNLIFQGEFMRISEPKLIGFAGGSKTKDIIVNEKPIKKYERTVISSGINLTFRKGNEVEYPMGYIKPQVTANNIKGGYDEMAMMFYGIGSFEVTYQIDKDINVQKIETLLKYRGTSSNKDVKSYIWNYKTSSYEEVSITSKIIDKELLEKYLNKDNIIKFKIDITGMEANTEVPRISVKGSVK